jgi:hypothetical protein
MMGLIGPSCFGFKGVSARGPAFWRMSTPENRTLNATSRRSCARFQSITDAAMGLHADARTRDFRQFDVRTA